MVLWLDLVYHSDKTYPYSLTCDKGSFTATGFIIFNKEPVYCLFLFKTSFIPVFTYCNF